MIVILIFGRAEPGGRHEKYLLQSRST